MVFHKTHQDNERITSTTTIGDWTVSRVHERNLNSTDYINEVLGLHIGQETLVIGTFLLSNNLGDTTCHITRETVLFVYHTCVLYGNTTVVSHTRCGRFTRPVYRGRTVTVSYRTRTVTVYVCDTEDGLTVLSLWPSHAPHVTINFSPPTFSFSFFLFFLNYSNNSAPPQPKKSHFMNGVTSR
jgi:hypothetical protein